MSSKSIYTLVAVTGIAAASGAAWWYQNKRTDGDAKNPSAAATAPAKAASGPGGGNRPVVVEVAKVQAMRLVDDVQAVGNLKSRQSVVLRPEVGGRITRLNFRDGDRVSRGQALVQLDDQLPAAQVKQAQAELSIAKANHKRNQDLAAQNFISARTVDESAAALDVAQAKLALAEATAKRLTIVAPFSGITGIRSVNVGDYLKDGADIVNLEDIDAVFVDFRLPERYQARLQRGQQAQVALDALPGKSFTATIQAIDPLIDANGRSVGVRGCLDNRAMQLRPGMFARITTVFGERADALVVPEEAIVPLGNKTWVVRIQPGAEAGSGTAQRVEVKLGIRRPGRVEVVSGLTAGDQVVTAGHQRIQKDGTQVKLLNALKPVEKSASNNGANQPSANPAASGASAAPAPAPAPASSQAGAAPAAVAPASATAAMQAKGAAAIKPIGGPNPCLSTAADAAGPRFGQPNLRAGKA